MSFVSPRHSMSPKVKLRGTLRVKGKQNLPFPVGPVINFDVPPNSKIQQNVKTSFHLLMQAGTKIAAVSRCMP